VGIVSINDALRLAQEADLDLVEVAPTARPPVAKLMDYGKFKYESALKARESRKNQAQTIIKEIKLRPKIDPHDYGTKKSHVERFLRQGDKVKVTIMFRGREQSRPELGFRLLQRLAADVEELGFVESQPRQDGRNMIMVIGPHRRKSEARAERARDAQHSERASSRSRAASTASAGTAGTAAPGKADAEAEQAATPARAGAARVAAAPGKTGAEAEQAATPARAGAARVAAAPGKAGAEAEQAATASEPPEPASAPEAGAAARARPGPATPARAGAARVAAAPRASARG